LLAPFTVGINTAKEQGGIVVAARFLDSVTGLAFLTAIAVGEAGPATRALGQTPSPAPPNATAPLSTPKAPETTSHSAPASSAEPGTVEGTGSSPSKTLPTSETKTAAPGVSGQDFPDDLYPIDLIHHPQSFFDLLLVVAAGAQVIIYLRQLRVYRQQAVLMSEQKKTADEQNMIATRLAQIQSDQNATQKRLPGVLERARLSFAGVLDIDREPVDLSDPHDQKWNIKFTWQNFGKTPAIEVEIDHFVVVLNPDENFDPSGHLKDYGSATHFPIPPGGTAPPVTFWIPSSVARRAEHKEVNIYAATRARYRDVIDDQSPHESLVCFGVTEELGTKLRITFLGRLCYET
jgi:hypothetical protein